MIPISFYDEYYSLPLYTHKEKSSEYLIDQYNKNHVFIVLVIFNLNKEICIVKNFSRDNAWELPGTFVSQHEKLEDVLERITRIETDIFVDEITPIAHLKNVFEFKDKEIIHEGIAFAALSRKSIIDTHNVKRKFFRPTDLLVKLPFQDNKLIDLFNSSFKDYKIPPLNEIESIKNISLLKYLTHKIVSVFFSNASKKIENFVLGNIYTEADSLLDSSCGDDSLVTRLCTLLKPSLVVANDISYRSLMRVYSNNDNILFTNHNIENLPFTKKFDVVIFKNTLHHIKNNRQEKIIFDLLSTSRKQLIVIDIENPFRGSFRSRIWNSYYRWFLDDQGRDFLTHEQFFSLMNRVVLSAGKKFKLRSGKINTSKGTYFWAIVDIV